MAQVAWIGLGVMGYPMAGHIRTKGAHDVVVFNRDGAKAAAWVAEFGGRSAPTPAAAAAGAELVFACVGNDDDLRAVTTDENGAFHGMGADTVFVDHTTASAEVARELSAAAAERGFSFLDAPVSGGQAGAQNGVLTVMVGGDEQAFTRAKPFISTYARAVNRIGPSGAGQLAKMVNQIAIAGMLQALAEAIEFAQNAGLKLPVVMETIANGAAQSWPLENRWKTMSEGRFDFGFAVDWMRKDLGICLAEAQRNGSSLPVTALVDQFYAELQRMGGGRWDTSSLIARLRHSAGSE
jgi:3-hydroxyisobutyrate dehydrogenase